LDPSKIMANGVAPTNCEKAERDISFGNAATWGTAKNTLESGDCVWAVKVANSSCPHNGHCNLPRYYVNKKPVDASKASSRLQSQRFPTKAPTAQAYDALTNAPAGGCRDSPGPVDKALYCAKTLDDTWVGYRWYKFVDQPALQQLHLTSEQRSFMQERVATLHKAMPSPVSKWINGRRADAEGLAKMDPAAIATPPKGLENGYVPIVLYQGYKKPSECVGPSPPAPPSPPTPPAPPSPPTPSPPSPPPPSPPSPPTPVPSQCGTCRVCFNPANHKCQADGAHRPKTKAACEAKGHIWCGPSTSEQYV
jgi:hypothetical protein